MASYVVLPTRNLDEQKPLTLLSMAVRTAPPHVSIPGAPRPHRKIIFIVCGWKATEELVASSKLQEHTHTLLVYSFVLQCLSTLYILHCRRNLKLLPVSAVLSLLSWVKDALPVAMKRQTEAASQQDQCTGTVFKDWPTGLALVITILLSLLYFN